MSAQQSIYAGCMYSIITFGKKWKEIGYQGSWILSEIVG